ncbi:MAG TPA: ABC transporter substrate-binding protein [Xanthobacteraceae bacterium]|nr:ABC transporter substrate-binding protein [Xanthobacteraceae bacterium]
MKRREFIRLLGGGTAMLSAGAARAQQPAMPVVGFVHSGSRDQNVRRIAAYKKGLSGAGFVDGENVTIEFHWADGHEDRLRGFVADVIKRNVAVISTAGSTPASLVAKAATSTIPIVFTTGTDPVALGLVASLNRPGGNLTGVTALNADLGAKRLGLLRQLVPQAVRYYTLVNPTSALAGPFVKDIEAGAASLGLRVEVVNASTAGEIDEAFEKIPQQPGTVLVVSTDAFFFTRRAQIVALAARRALPAMFDNREIAEAGGLISYGADFFNVMQLAGDYTGLILKGEKPADLPVVQSTKFEMVINLKTAKALGLAVPSTLLAVADDVIE